MRRHFEPSSFPNEQADFSEEIYGGWFNVDSHLGIAEVVTEKVICNAI